MTRNDFGTVRLLDSGKYQARYTDAEGQRRSAETFARVSDATHTR